MVSELGLIYIGGKHWTGSMIELGYGHHECNFKKNRNWMEPVEDSSFKCNSRRNNSRKDGQRGLVASGLFIEHFLESTSDGTPNGSALPPSLARYILQLLKEKDGFRHSLTSLLPSEIQEPFGYEFWHRKARCRSCEPQAKSSQFGSAALSTFFFENFFLNLQDQLAQCSTSPPRKRLSHSDSEICYAKDLPEPTVKDTLERDSIVEVIPEVSEETTPVESSESVDSPDEPARTLIFEAGTTEEEDNDEEEQKEEKECSAEPIAANPPIPTSEEFEQPSENPPVIKLGKKKKSVRFADDVGSILCQEKIIADTSLPPNLHLSFDDDFRDLGDDSLPGVVRPTFKTLGPKTNSLPVIMKTPPPIPQLHHSSSSNEALNLTEPKPITSPTSGYSNWRVTFAQPAAQYLAFRQRLDSKFVSLENITLTNRPENANNLFIYGKAKVKNIAFEKRVKLRVTTDCWKSYKDYPAVYNAQAVTSSSGTSLYDQFMFNFSVDISQMPEPRQVQFAVCFQVGHNGEGGEYWDNNDGCNYVIIEQAASPPVGSYDSFRDHPSVGTEGSPMRTAVGGTEQSPPGTAYTLDYRPNFNSFSSLTYYSSWQHYSSESMYY